ncbi:5-deoxy-glucuronate isomerase [Enterococcus sp. AZ109]|uniref:5-deoxy-glucuronate isomerase n=1 Tax=Enterococcus sp. AZ109 TaxID=2774634 RepID=UPI003F280C6E
MSNSLKQIPQAVELSQGVTQLQNIRQENSGLNYIEFQVLEFEKGATYPEKLGKQEVCIVALTGKITVEVEEEVFKNLGTRESVFEKIPTDSVYISNDHQFSITAETDNVRVALCYSPSEKQLPIKVIKAADNSIEQRGKYQNKRLVHNILPDDVDTANSLLVVEVYTEGGNFSSYPPHKHDQDDLPNESFLEETYYHEMNPSQGFVFQRVYTEDRSLDETMSVENKNVVVVPKGYHPVGVPDGYTSYYLNVMAGPTRIWQFHNEKAHEWILDRQ